MLSMGWYALKYDHTTVGAVRITTTLPIELVHAVDKFEKNRSKFVMVAIQKEVKRREREALRKSLHSVHPESSKINDDFQDWIKTLGQMKGYMPSNESLQVEHLAKFAEAVDGLNNAVAEKSQFLQTQRKERLALYDDMGHRVQKIKAYVKAQYGIKSKEYEMVKGVSV